MSFYWCKQLIVANNKCSPISTEEKKTTKKTVNVKQEVEDVPVGNGIQSDFIARNTEEVLVDSQQEQPNDDPIDKSIDNAVVRTPADSPPGKNDRNNTPAILNNSSSRATLIEPNNHASASIDLENATISMTANGNSNNIDANKKQVMTPARFIRIDSSTGTQKICRPILIRPVNATHSASKPVQPSNQFLPMPSSSSQPTQPIVNRKRSIHSAEQSGPAGNSPMIIQPRLSVKPINDLMPTKYRVVKTSMSYVGAAAPRIVQAVSLMPAAPRTISTATQPTATQQTTSHSVTTNATKKPVRVLNGLISMPKDFDTTLTLNQLGVNCVQPKRITATPQIEQVYGGATKLFNGTSSATSSPAVTSTVPMISSVTSLNTQASGAIRSNQNKESTNGQKSDIANRQSVNGMNIKKPIANKIVLAIAAANEPKISDVSDQKRNNENGQKNISEKSKKIIANAGDDDDAEDYVLLDLRCNICVFLSKTPTEFTEHMLHEHNKPFVCRICHKIFNSKAYLEIHKTDGNCSNKLNADRSYVCIVPAPRVVNENNVKQLHCKSCPHVFPDERNYVHHAQQHAKRFRCKLCKEQQIFNMDDMKKHLEAHYLKKLK